MFWLTVAMLTLSAGMPSKFDSTNYLRGILGGSSLLPYSSAECSLLPSSADDSDIKDYEDNEFFLFIAILASLFLNSSSP